MSYVYCKSCGYFIDWPTNDNPCFSPCIEYAKKLSKAGAENLLKLLKEIYPGEIFRIQNIK